MNAIIAINGAYIEAKGKTFFAYQLMFDNPLTSDRFINDTLEHLRQTTRIGVARGDDQQIEQTLRAMAELVRVYLARSEEHTSELQSLMRISYAVFCLKK